MPQIDVNCPYCDDEYTVEIENQSDGDIEEIECACGKSFDVEISFSLDGIVYKKDVNSEEQVCCGKKDMSGHKCGESGDDGIKRYCGNCLGKHFGISELSEVKDGN